jgi:hypothetical protein
MALRFLERELRRLLAERGREELMDAEVGGIALTDDGGTIYVHLFPRHRQGRAFVLAWEDYTPAGSERMHCYRWLVNEARTSLRENADKIARWLEET